LESLSAERLQRWFVKGGEEREGFGRLSPMKWSSALKRHSPDRFRVGGIATNAANAGKRAGLAR